MEIKRPLVMGILNVTPDSFYAVSRTKGAEAVAARVKEMLADGADIIDVGGCSTRPSAGFVSEDEELERLHLALDVIDNIAPAAVVSIDTFRGRVVRECVARHNVAIVNDVSGCDWDDDMFDAVVSVNKPYVLTHSVGKAGEYVCYTDFFSEQMQLLSKKMWQLRQEGVNDIIIDPGFGFGKTMEQNYAMLSNLHEYSLLDAPLLVGVSRKSMITKLLACAPETALSGTIAANALAVAAGTDILRVHDVKEAAETVKVVCKANECKDILIK